MSRFACVVVAVVASAATVGCGSSASDLESAPAVTVQRVGTAVREPVWSYAADALLGLTADRRVAKIAGLGGGSRPDTLLSARLPDVGENLQISPVDEHTAYVPEPSRGEVALVRVGDLRVAGTLAAGREPSYLALDSGLRVLLALSADGSTVTAVDLHRGTTMPPTTVDAGPRAEIEGANRGREVEFHVIGPDGIAHYKGHASPADKKGEFDSATVTSAGDGTKVTRIYAAERGGGTLLAVDSRRDGTGMHVVGSADLGAPIRYLATDDTRIYAATERRLFVLEARSFEGYDHGTIPVIRSFDIVERRPPGLARAALSGMTVGPHRVYLAVRDRPYVISVAKPRL
jgi:hypothetical protein